MLNKKKTQFYLLNILVFGLVFFMDCLFPYAIDDYIYGEFANPESVGEAIISSFAAIYNFFFTWGNRVVGNYFAFLMVFLDKMVYNVCNAIIHVTLGNLIYIYVRPKEKYNVKLLGSIFMALWIFTPEYGMTVIWTNASTIYQWVMIPLLAFGLVYYSALFDNKDYSKCSPIKIVLLTVGNFILGVVAGNSLEPAVCSLLLGGLFWLMWCYRTKRTLRPWEWSGIVGCLLSFVVLILGPGSAARSKVVREQIGEQNIIKELAIRLARETYYTTVFLGVLIGICLALMVIAYEMNKNGKSESKKSRYIKAMIIDDWRAPLFFLLAMVSIYVMTFSIAFANRIFLTPTILLIISCMISIERIHDRCNDKVLEIIFKAEKILLIAVCIFVLAQYTTAMLQMYKTNEPFVKTTMFVNYNQDLF